jgi:serine/threonine-protein kinase
VGSYTLDFRLGYGGMGEVWRAKHRTLARDAAVKLIRTEVLQSSSGKQVKMIRQRFEREAQATASLRSPHTVALYDFGQSKGGSFYYVMELLDGVDLQTLVEQYGPMPPGRVVHILSQVAQSLEEAHAKQLVHRDIKPRNILLCKLGLQYDFTKVLDFGLVKSLHDDSDLSKLTVDGVTAGTPAYMPPEIALGNRDVDGRADLYSLGCVAYYLLSGQLVFEETTPTAYAIAHVQTPPPPIGGRTELHVPPDLERLVMQLLEKSPANRVQSARELDRRLRALGVPQWCPDEAAEWWQTNLPDLPARPVVDTESMETELAATPVGSRLQA